MNERKRPAETFESITGSPVSTYNVVNQKFCRNVRLVSGTGGKTSSLVPPNRFECLTSTESRGKTSKDSGSECKYLPIEGEFVGGELKSFIGSKPNLVVKGLFGKRVMVDNVDGGDT